jgi:NAD(P)-dependent dehydrogenase (short-subunit alcohol dehydrogenase family)
VSAPVQPLAGKVALVTGASSGIGAATAAAMAAAGADVVLTGRDRERLAAAAAAAGEDAHAEPCDLTADGAPEALVAAAVERFGTVDVIFHSAGIFEPRPFPESDLASFDRQWALNVRAPYALTQAALPHLLGGGVVIFVSSIAGHAAFPHSAAYCATKGAIEMLVRSLATELAPRGVRVNAIAPGNIHSPMNAEFMQSPEYEQSMIDQTPAGRVGVVEDVAPAAVFLASEAGRYIHGISLLVDGGWSA